MMSHHPMPWIFVGQESVSHRELEKVVSIKLYGIGHALSKTELDPTPKSCMLRSFMEGYTAYHYIYFMLYVTVLYRVAWAFYAYYGKK